MASSSDGGNPPEARGHQVRPQDLLPDLLHELALTGIQFSIGQILHRRSSRIIVATHFPKASSLL